MSIKWKLSLAFILLSLGVVGLYIATAKRTFESDKISYVFDSQQRQVTQIGNDFGERVTRILFDARAILSGLDDEKKLLNTDAQSLFDTHKAILAIDFRELTKTEPIAFLKKDDIAGAELARLAPSADVPGKISLSFLGDSRFLVSTTQQTAERTAVLRALFQLDSIFSRVSEGQTLILVQNDQPVVSSNEKAFTPDALKAFLKDRESKDVAATTVRELDGKNYLISATPIRIGGYSLIALTDQSVALAALDVLYKRSLAFLAMSFFATVIIALFLSNSLTRNINDLKRVAEQIAGGDFQAVPEFQSKDEVGVLAGAFKRMASEIQKLLLATADKARMEAELKTAALVQESLFPQEDQFTAGQYKIGGSYVTSTECGGDWWYYFRRGDYLYVIVADATGHGTPAALITSAARSIFSYIQTKELQLSEIASLCDDAIFQCSKGRVYMTALILKIHVESGDVSFINACHEAPYLWTKADDGERTGDYVVSEPDMMFGETKHVWNERKLKMNPGDKLIVYTDGVTAVENLEKRSIPNRKVGKIFTSALADTAEPVQASREINRALGEYSQGQPLPDDITLVVIERLDAGAETAKFEEEMSVAGAF